MAVRRSAALLPYLISPTGEIEVFIAHMGGPLWSNKDEGAWSLAKGEYADDEEPEAAARREFREEVGVPAPAGPPIDLGECRQRSGKRIRTFAVRSTRALRFAGSNEFEMEWPRGSGLKRRFPEVDRAEWFPISAAHAKLVPGQGPILAALEAAIAGEAASAAARKAT